MNIGRSWTDKPSNYMTETWPDLSYWPNLNLEPKVNLTSDQYLCVQCEGWGFDLRSSCRLPLYHK